MGNCQGGLIDPCYFESVGMRLYVKVTPPYGRLDNNIHGSTPINNHFHKSFPTFNKGIKDGGTFSLIV